MKLIELASTKTIKRNIKLDVAFPHDYETVNNSTYLDKLTALKL